MAYRKGSINRLLQDEYARLDQKPKPLTAAWDHWLDGFWAKYPLEVSRMRHESLHQRAIAVLRFRIPGWD